MNKKYVLCPGYIRSKYDGEDHFISSRALINLYRVNPQECIDGNNPEKLRGYSKDQLRAFTWLHPQYSVDNYDKIRGEIHNV